MSQYFLQFGIILFPLWAYQIWTFHRSFRELPGKTFIMGIYGSGAAIAAQSMPLMLFNISENFQCVPIILSCLYGKRKSGLLAIGILIMYQFASHKVPVAAISSLGIIVYSILPLAMCNRYEHHSKNRRLLLGGILSVITLVIQILFIIALLVLSGVKWRYVLHYADFIAVAAVIQLCLMFIASVVMENIIIDGQVRRRLEHSEQRYQSLVQYNPYGVCGVDKNDIIFMVNRAYQEIVGYTREELIGMSRFNLWPPEDIAFGASLMDAAQAGVVQRDIEFDILDKSGRRIHVNCTKFPIVVDGEVSGYYSVVSDVSRIKMIEDKVVKTERLATIGQLAPGIAYDLRERLESVRSSLSLFATASFATEDNPVDVMERELETMERTVSEMVLLSEIRTVHYRVVNIYETLQEVRCLLRAEAEQYSVVMQLQDDQEPGEFIGERNQLKYALITLVKDAIHEMPHGGTLTVVVAHEHQDLVVRLTSERYRANDEHETSKDKFRFKRGNDNKSNDVQGDDDDLGILLSEHILKMHGGSMEVVKHSEQTSTRALRFPLSFHGEEAEKLEAVDPHIFSTLAYEGLV